MSLSITPAMQPLPIPMPSPQQAADAQRLNRVADSAAVRNTAARAVRDDDTPSVPGVQREVLAKVDTPTGQATVQVWDVNGDGTKDAVLRDTATGATTALLNKGGDNAPVFTGPSVNISTPTQTDVNRLAVPGGQSGRAFLATDTDGDGLRQLAVKRHDGVWISLGEGQDQPGRTGVDEAEARFAQLLAQMIRLLPVSMPVRGLLGFSGELEGDDWSEALGHLSEGLAYGHDTATPLVGNQVPLDTSFWMLWALMADEWADPDQGRPAAERLRPA
jgi:hypothetical protein